jgi:hypothetical protein
METVSVSTKVQFQNRKAVPAKEQRIVERKKMVVPMRRW